ncbi:HAMP domain-containing sensor histidine kinase [Kitasatospora paracochleata]|uniref:histidine kinase n=1 Tax=Kitasatospora paracochleata TaxID=58354 RepID=A0ABT1J6I5_9ACTN|nr:HAMP domain-containing sensor histidine kinase [Kitasatospora paracochleata]MCP2313008.1 signal transduction histidine kinase [Kitasatospora paracochleata]
MAEPDVRTRTFARRLRTLAARPFHRLAKLLHPLAKLLRRAVGRLARLVPRPLRTRLAHLAPRLVPRSVRARATVAATAVVALALGLASVALMAMVHSYLLRRADDDASQQALSVARMAADGTLPTVLPIHGADFVTVVNANGQVVTFNQGLVGRPPGGGPFHRPAPPDVPLPPGAAAPSGAQVVGPGARILPFGPYRQRVVQTTTDGPGGRFTVYAGTSMRDIDAAFDVTAAALAVGVPLMLLTVALVTWRVTGRALRPVEAIRAEFAEITGQDLHRRVPVPRTDDEVARLALTVNTTLDRLEDAGTRQRRFIADASHELRSPITVLRTQLEVALAHPAAADWPELVRDALQDTVRLQDLAADLLLLARLDAADPVATEPLDLAALVTGTLAARGPERIPVTTDLAPGTTVRGNRNRLTRLLTNLLDNAQRYADRQVEVRLEQVGRTAVLEVRDDGPGIPADDRERVFERFTRLDDARSRELGGAGLGLAIARDLAAHHGGTLTAEPAARGARLVARLPLAD